MAPSTFAVFMLCFTYMTYGAVVYNREGIMKSSGGDRSIRRSANPVKRSATTPTFETKEVGNGLQRNGNPILNSTLARYESTFLDTAPGNKLFRDVMTNIYDLAETKWKLQRNIIDELLSVKYATLHIRDTRSLQDFYNRTINIYTMRIMYKELNAALRDYKTQPDTLFGPYALVLNVVLSKWTALTTFNGTTYRGANFTTEGYTVNTIITWTAFTSSSTCMKRACRFAHKVLFVIDNSVNSDWRPKDVEGMSHFPEEKERLYSMSTMFKVTMVKLGACGNLSLKEIHMSLEAGDDPNKTDNIAVNPNKADINVRTMRGGTAVAAMIAVVAVLIIA